MRGGGLEPIQATPPRPSAAIWIDSYIPPREALPIPSRTHWRPPWPWAAASLASWTVPPAEPFFKPPRSPWAKGTLDPGGGSPLLAAGGIDPTPGNWWGSAGVQTTTAWAVTHASPNCKSDRTRSPIQSGTPPIGVSVELCRHQPLPERSNFALEPPPWKTTDRPCPWSSPSPARKPDSKTIRPAAVRVEGEVFLARTTYLLKPECPPCHRCGPASSR